SYHADSEFLDNYAEMEAKIAQSVNALLNVPSSEEESIQD
ncbi:zinc-binding domain protein, partial [Vibrio cholerae CP1041(14)]